MKFALVGVGGAGGRIVDRLRRDEAETGRSFSKGSVLAFDTEREPFKQYDHIPLDRHVLVGDTNPEIRGEGVDGDVDLAASVAREDRDELHREFDKLDLHELDAVLVVAGLGGGTGGGVGAVVLESLDMLTDIPVYVLGVLPTEGESDRHVLNTARSLQPFVRLADSVMLFDNESWYDSSAEESLEEQYETLNGVLADRILAVLALGELDSADIAENTLDSSDLMRTLNTGGISTIGQASLELDTGGVLSRLVSVFRNGEDDEPDTTLAMRTQDLIKRAGTRKLTLPCEISSADRALIVLSGPPEECSRKGFESARYWLEQETGAVEVFAGDEPRPNADVVSASILLSNVTEIPRVDALKQRAVEVQREKAASGVSQS